MITRRKRGMGRLALLGGKRIRTRPYPPHVTTGDEELHAVQRVLKGGVLSAFEGTNNARFLGGPEVVSLEAEWAERFGVRYAVAVNSATSGLMAAVGAAGISPGDEVIVPPWTMTATPAAILAYHAIPVFCDITPDTFTVDPEALRRLITPRTRAVMPVHLFGHPAKMDPILEIARAHRLTVIEDAAQSPTATDHGRLTGTLGELGVFSLNCNKHIQCGEGGIVVTNDTELANRVRLIRNHAEAVIATGFQVKRLVNMVGGNYRMTELEAAIARTQLGKLDRLIEARLALVDQLTQRLSGLPGLVLPSVSPGCTHVYYRYAIRLDPSVVPVSAAVLVRVLNAEGMRFYPGFVPLYLQPLYQQRIVYGERGCPFACGHYHGQASYDRGICPVAERLRDEVISTEVVRPPLTTHDLDEIAEALGKVLRRPDDLLEAHAQLEAMETASAGGDAT